MEMPTHPSAARKTQPKFLFKLSNHLASSFRKSSALQPHSRQGDVGAEAARTKAAAWAWYQRRGGNVSPTAEFRDCKAMISGKVVSDRSKSRFKAEATRESACNDSSSKSPLQYCGRSLYDEFEILTLQKHVAKLTQSLQEEAASPNAPPSDRGRSLHNRSDQRNSSSDRSFSDISCARQIPQQTSEKGHARNNNYVDGNSILDEEFVPKPKKSSFRRPFSVLQKFFEKIGRVKSSRHSDGYQHGENHYHYYHHHHFYYHHSPDDCGTSRANEEENYHRHYHHRPDEDTRSPQSGVPRKRHSANFYERPDHEVTRSPDQELPRRRRHSMDVLYDSSVPEGPQIPGTRRSTDFQDQYSVHESPQIPWSRRYSDSFSRYSGQELGSEDYDTVWPLPTTDQYSVHKGPQISRRRRYSDSFSRYRGQESGQTLC